MNFSHVINTFVGRFFGAQQIKFGVKHDIQISMVILVKNVLKKEHRNKSEIRLLTPGQQVTTQFYVRTDYRLASQKEHVVDSDCVFTPPLIGFAGLKGRGAWIDVDGKQIYFQNGNIVSFRKVGGNRPKVGGIMSSKSNELIAMDHFYCDFSGKKRCSLHIIDHFSRFSMFFISDLSAQAVCKSLIMWSIMWSVVFRSLPKVVLTDSGHTI